VESNHNPGFYKVSVSEQDIISRSYTLSNGWQIRTMFSAKKFNQIARKRYHKLSLALLAVMLTIGALAAFVSNQINGPISWLLRRTLAFNVSNKKNAKPMQISPYVPSEMVTLVRAYESAERRLKIAFEAERLHQQKRDHAEKANEAKSVFLSSMSHELRTPLNAISGFCQLLKEEDSLTSDAKELSNEIFIASQHLMLLINDILDLSKIEAGQLHLNVEDVGLVKLIDNSLKLVSNQAQSKHVAINWQKREQETYVKADRLRLKQVLINLLSNAIKYNRENGEVSISINTDQTSCEIKVQDNGVGIESKKLAQMFKPFERLGQEGAGIDGYGIGLMVTKKLIEAMQGEIDVSSEVGRGSCFNVIIPLASKQQREAARQTVKPLFDIEPCRVLYVEDNDVNALVMEKAMKRFPQIEYQREATGEAGLARMRAAQFDFVLLDITLPDMSGFEILETIKSNSKFVFNHVFAVSANALAEDIRRGLESGFDEYLTKPVRFELLFELIVKRQK
ncbi:MAG: ATP-binding protein, partial [Kangiellaceae bacterium]|nr:ATP-binding protein [Kangiellaceae bacterium]